jgi:hypothetical protein
MINIMIIFMMAIMYKIKRFGDAHMKVSGDVRGSAELRHSMTEAIRRRIGHLSAKAKGDTAHAKRRAATAPWSAMVGAMVLARIVDDEKRPKDLGRPCMHEDQS